MKHHLALLCGLIAAAPALHATETENLGFRVLPAPAKVTIDASAADWDLSGGIFACGDVENARERYALWFHAMYDAENLYLLARWNDPTPLNHPGSSKGDYGFQGDCLQVRVVTAPDVTASEVKNPGRDSDDAPAVRTTHVTAWRDRDKIDVVNLEYGRRFKEGGLKDAQEQGAAQEFALNADGSGYVQEIAIPWKLLTKPGTPIKSGSVIMLTIEPNFTVGTGSRLTIKDLFKSGVPLDRVFTFQGNGSWGYATLEAQGNVALAPVRLSDKREFPVRLENGVPVADWTGLAKTNLPDGFKSIKINLPQDGFVSLNLFAPDGTVARQLLTAHPLNKGEHEIKWDGLATWSVRQPGAALPAGDYKWEGFYHSGIGLKLRGWAGNSGSAPWRGWGADHGNPVAAASAGNMVFLGWGGGEGDKPLQASDLNGNILWKNIRGGIAGAGPIATDGVTVFAFNPIGQYAKKAIYRVDAKTGAYTEWSDLKSTDLTLEQLLPGVKELPYQPSGLAAANGKVFVSFAKQNLVVVVDAVSGKILKNIEVPGASGLATSGENVFVWSSPNVLSLNAETGASKTVFSPPLAEGDWVSALTTDKTGHFYLGIRGQHHFVAVFDAAGKRLRTIGRENGRALSGPWTPDAMLNIAALAVDENGKLWVAEDDGSPKRVSVWNAQSGAFEKEFFGSSSYGATGACINPRDPNIMVGQGVEWRLDPQTGKSTVLGTITRDGMGASRFGFAPDGRLFLATTPNFLHGDGPIRLFERLGDGHYKQRTEIRRAKAKNIIEVWADANDDAQEQPGEVQTYEKDLGGWLSGWYMPMTPELAFYGSLYQIKPTGWTACGAPQFDLSQAKLLPGPDNAKQRGGMGAQHGHGSADGRFMLWNAGYGIDHGTMDCYDMQTRARLWSYPSNFTGVHGSHRAGPATVGQLRGAYDITGSAKLPDPIGNIWVIPTNKGEWHVLTEKGFYLTRLWEGDPTKNVWPEAKPGASLDTCPPGAGEEAFGGSISQARDGSLSVQAGHISYWNAAVTGLDTVKPLPGGTITLSEADTRTAQEWRGRALQSASEAKKVTLKKATPVFTGDLAKDFAGAPILKFQKGDDTAVRSAAAWDENNLYLAWDVQDATPWINGADAPEFLYARGDTVDFQLGTDPKAPAARKDGVLGDFRLSIGAFQNQPTAVLYRKVAAQKNPKIFNSGVVQGYTMDSVTVLQGVLLKVTTKGKRTVVQAAIPLAALEFKPAPGLVLRGDFGATHSDAEGRDTVLRTHWSNQNTGLVSDEVFELQMTPSAWGEITFE